MAPERFIRASPPLASVYIFSKAVCFFMQLCDPVCLICCVPMETASACREPLFWEAVREGAGTAASEVCHRLRSKQNLRSMNIFIKYREWNCCSASLCLLKTESMVRKLPSAYIKRYWINLCLFPGFLKGPCSMFRSCWRLFHSRKQGILFT